MPQPPTQVFRLYSRAFLKQVSLVQCLQCCGPRKLRISQSRWFLAAFVKLRKVSINSFIPLCVSIWLEHLCCHWTDFYEIWYSITFRNSVKKIQAC